MIFIARKYKRVKRKELTFDLSDWEKIKRRAEACHTDTTKYLRRMILDREPIFYDMKNVAPMINGMRTISRNINQIAKKAKAKAIISQHINSGTAKGVECYYSIDGTGKSLASKMCSLTAKETGMSNRGAKTKESGTTAGKDYYAIIRYARSTDDGGAITGLIMENGFIQKDYDYMDTDEDLDKIAKANAAAIIDYYGD